MFRVAAVAIAVIATIALLRVDVVGRLTPWSPACVVSGPQGESLLVGDPPDIVAAVGAPANGELRSTLAAGPAVSCRIRALPVTDDQKEGPLGLTPRAQRLRAEVRRTFGDVPDGGFGPEEVLPGRGAGNEHSLGRAIDFFFRPHEDPDSAEAGWQLANWAVANADRLGVRVVIYRDRIWSARRSAEGWRDYRFGGRDPANPINRHLDHVHIDVA